MFSEEDKEFFIDVLTNGLDVSAFRSIDISNTYYVLKDVCNFLNVNHTEDFYWVDDLTLFFDHKGIMGEIFCFFEGSVLIFSLTVETPENLDICSKFAINVLNYFYAKESALNVEENLARNEAADTSDKITYPSIYDEFDSIPNSKINKITDDMKRVKVSKLEKQTYDQVKNKVKEIIKKSKFGYL